MPQRDRARLVSRCDAGGRVALASAQRRRARTSTYPDVQPGAPLAFPADDGAHPAFRTEWWYVTGWLRDARGARARLPGHVLPQPARRRRNERRAASRRSSCCSRMRRSPIPQSARLRHRPARRARGLRTRRAQRRAATDVRIDDWSLVQRRRSLSPRTSGARRSRSTSRSTRSAPPLLQGERGVSRKGPRPARCELLLQPAAARASSGRVTIDERTRDSDRRRMARSRMVEPLPAARRASAGTGSASTSTTAAR